MGLLPLGIAQEKLFRIGRPPAAGGRSAMWEKLFFGIIRGMFARHAQAVGKSFS
jgi:hypothetical protein